MAQTIDPTVVAYVTGLAEQARVASRRLALMSRAEKDAVLLRLADAVDAATPAVVAANREDLERGRRGGMSESLQDRLRLDEQRVGAVAQALRDVAALPDPVGEVVRGSTLANGLQIRQVRVPMGVIGMIYEARPNVTVDAAGLALKSGNAVILRGGSAAASSNHALVRALRESLEEQGLPADAIVDLVIPRGGADLIQTVVRESTVPVIETGVGVCHVYVDRGADLDKALAITLNAKTQRPSVCNAAESLLVHRDVAGDFLPKALADLAGAGVRLHVGPHVTEYADAAGVAYELASDDDFGTEWHGLEMSVAVVGDIDEAMDRIRRYGTGHTEAIVTEDRGAARRFTAEVDAAAVMVNASTRFTDGGEFGFGAEIGISTQKLHARGPMALPELTTTKWVVEGDGHVR
jgi:glutamate-5-semialdehyde dehydrogenase